MILPGVMALSGGSAGARVAVVSTVLPTVLGTFDVTVPQFGTPKAVIAYLGIGLTDNVATSNAVGSIGASDGTAAWSCGWASFDSRSGIQSWRDMRTGLIGHVLDAAGSRVVQLGLDSLIADGARLDLVANAGPSPHLLKLVMIGGSNVEAAAGTRTLAAQNSAVTVATGHETRALVAASAVTLPNANGSGVSAALHGFAAWDGAAVTQAAATFRVDDNQPVAVQGDARANGVLSWPTARYAAVENVTGGGFDLRSIGGDLSSFAAGYLSLSGLDAWAGVVDAPATTGPADLTGAPFTPVAVLLRPSMFTATDTNQTSGEAGGFALAALGQGEASYAWEVRDAVNPSDTGTLAADKGVALRDHTGTLAFEGSLDGFIAGGVRVIMTTANATVRKWPALFLA